MIQEHFYDPVSHSGFIEIKLRNLRRNLHDDQRRYHRKRYRMSDASTESISLKMSAKDEESTQVWTTVTKWMKPSPENLTTIKVGMEQTYTSRRLWIANQSPTVNEIFEQYPRFADMPYLVRTGKVWAVSSGLWLWNNCWRNLFFVVLICCTVL